MNQLHRLTATSSNGTSSSSPTNSNCIFVRTNINLMNSTIPLIFILLLIISLLFICFVIWVVLWQIFDIHLHTSSKSITFFGRKMYCIRLVLVVLLSHHSLGLVDYFPSFFFSYLFEWEYVFDLFVPVIHWATYHYMIYCTMLNKHMMYTYSKILEWSFWYVDYYNMFWNQILGDTIII